MINLYSTIHHLAAVRAVLENAEEYDSIDDAAFISGVSSVGTNERRIVSVEKRLPQNRARIFDPFSRTTSIVSCVDLEVSDPIILEYHRNRRRLKVTFYQMRSEQNAAEPDD